MQKFFRCRQRAKKIRGERADVISGCGLFEINSRIYCLIKGWNPVSWRFSSDSIM